MSDVLDAEAPDRLSHVRRFFDTFAADYDGWMRVFDGLFLGDRRQRLCARAGGRILEVAVGTGRNLPYYSPGAALAGVDLSPAMLAIAARCALSLSREVDLSVGNAEALAFPDAHFDTVVITLGLCTIPDERRALQEAHRVLRPGGQLLLLEHVRSPAAPVRWAQRLLDPLARLSGDHLLRDPLDHLSAAGFTIERLERAKWGVTEEVTARKQ